MKEIALDNNVSVTEFMEKPEDDRLLEAYLMSHPDDDDVLPQSLFRQNSCGELE